MNRFVRTGLIVASLAGLLPLTTFTATTASASSVCGTQVHVTFMGGEAWWKECRDGAKVQVSGTVKDTAANGRCAYVYATYDGLSGVDTSPHSCPKGNSHTFTFPWRTSADARVYLASAVATS